MLYVGQYQKGEKPLDTDALSPASEATGPSSLAAMSMLDFSQIVLSDGHVCIGNTACQRDPSIWCFFAQIETRLFSSERTNI
jgi:hypothetical protein